MNGRKNIKIIPLSTITKFKNGYKIDISKFYQYKINTVYISAEPEFYHQIIC